VKSSKVINETLKSEDLKNHQAVDASDVEADTLTAPDIGPDAVGSSEIADGSVKSSAIVDGDVGSSQIATNGVTDLDVAANAIGSSEIGTEAVGSSEVLNDSITGDDISDGALDATNLDAPKIVRVESFGAIFEEAGLETARNADYTMADQSVSCNDNHGNGELIAGYATWDGNQAVDQEEVYTSEVRLNMETETVTVIGGLDTGIQGPGSFQILYAEGICLEY
jgi:hypothetical protein